MLIRFSDEYSWKFIHGEIEDVTFTLVFFTAGGTSCIRA